jgi:hypothetical protein
MSRQYFLVAAQQRDAELQPMPIFRRPKMIQTSNELAKS